MPARPAAALHDVQLTGRAVARVLVAFVFATIAVLGAAAAALWALAPRLTMVNWGIAFVVIAGLVILTQVVLPEWRLRRRLRRWTPADAQEPAALVDALIRRTTPTLHAYALSLAAARLVELGVANVVVRVGRVGEWPPVVPIASTFEPRPAASSTLDGDDGGPGGGGRPARIGVAVLGLAWLLCLALWATGRGIVFLGLAGVALLGMFRVARYYLAPGLWLTNGLLAQRRGDRWRLMRREAAVLIALWVPFSKECVVVASDGGWTLRLHLPVAAAGDLLAGWLSPVEPVPVERWEDYE